MTKAMPTTIRFAGLLLGLCLASSGLAQKAQPIRLAAPGLKALNIDANFATFVSEHFAQRLMLEGISVVAAGEVEALIGLERQRQLMGCTEDASSCLAEMADALGADGIITGTVAKLGTLYQVNLKILSSKDGRALAIVSRKAYGDEDLLELLDAAAVETADTVRANVSKARERAQRPEPEEPRRDEDEVADPPRTEPEEERTAKVRVAVDERQDGEQPRSSDSSQERRPAKGVAAARQNAVHLDILGLLPGIYGLEFERVLFQQISGFVHLAAVHDRPMPFFNHAGVEALVGARYYFGDQPLRGLAVGLNGLVGYGGDRSSSATLFVGYRGELYFKQQLGEIFQAGFGAYLGQRFDLFGFDWLLGLRLTVGAQF